jgi:hypothetical protein
MRKTISNMFDEFVAIKTAQYNGDIRREIEECFTEWLEEQTGKHYSERRAAEITRIALSWI